jgi:hypothetical protein
MTKKSYGYETDRAAVLFSPHRAAALFVLYALVSALSQHRALAQSSSIDGGQMNVATNLQSGATYTVAASDCGKLLSLSNAVGVVVTIPQAGSSGLHSGCWIDIQVTGSGGTFTATGTTIDGAPSFSLVTNQGLRLVSNGTAYYTERGQGSGTGSGGGGGALAIESGSTALGTATTLNVVGGTGVSCVPQVSAGVATLQCNADTSYLASRVSLQSATNPQLCTSSSANGATYTASCATTLTAYAALQTLFWFADVANTSTTPTLNIDTLGANPLVRYDGTALAINDIKAGALYRIWYDGANARVVEAGVTPVSSTGSTATSTRGLFASRGACGATQSGNTFYSIDIAHFSQCNGSSWADYYQGQPVSLPGSASFTTLNGTGATITTNGISTISALATSATDIIGQEIAVPQGTWTIVAWLEPEDQGVTNGLSPARLLYVRDGSNKMVALYAQTVAGSSNVIEWVHISSPTAVVTSAQGSSVAATGQFIPFLRIQFDGTNFIYSGCTTYNAATAAGTNNYGGGNCERFYFEPAASYLSTPVAVGWGIDAHSGSPGVTTNAVTALHWQVTN